MSDIAKLNLAVDSSETVIAIKSLEQLAQISAEAEKAAEKLGGATKQQAKRLSELDKAAKANEATERRSIGQVLERARAYTKTAGAEVAALQAAERNRNSTRKLAEEQEKLRNGLSKLLAVIDPLEAKLNKLDDAEVKLHKTFRAGVIDAEKYAETLAKIGAKRNDIVEKQLKEIGEGAGFASEMIKVLGLNSRESQRDLLNLGRAAASGNWSQVQSSMFQITRSSGALSIALSGVGMSVGAVTAGVGALGYMYYQSYRENQEFNRSLALTGNAAGTTTERLTAMSRSISENITYAANTAKAVQEVARTGKITADSIEEVALASVQMQQAFGQAVDQTVSEFVRLGEAPSTALLELNDKYHHLTFSVYEQVRALEEQGREEEAMALAQRHHSEQLGIRANEVIENIGAIERAWLRAKKASQNTWDAFLNIGREQTVYDRIVETKAKIAALDLNPDELLDPVAASYAKQIVGQSTKEQLEEKLKIYEEEKRNLEAIDELEKRRLENEQQKIKQNQQQTRYLEQNQPKTLEHELKKARENLSKLTDGVDKESERYKAIMEAFYREEAEIRKRYEKKSSGNNSFASEVARLKARIEEESNFAAAAENTIAQVSRLNEFERRGMQLRNLAAKETKAANKAKLEELATLNEQAGALVRTNKLTEEAAKERLRYLEGIEKSTERTRDEAQKIRDQARTMGMSKAALEELTNARIKEQIAQLQGKKGSEEEIKLLKEQLVVREDLVKAIGEHDVAREGYEAQRKAEQEWRKTIENIDDVFRKGFADMLNRGEDSWKSFTKSLTATFKTAVADQIYKMFAQPFVAQVAVGVSGLLGGGAAAAASAQGAGGGLNLFGGLSGVNSLANAFSGGVVNSLSSAIGGLGNAFGSSALTSFASGMAGTLASTSAAGISAIGSTAAASLGTTVGTGALGATAYSSGMSAATLGAKFAAVAPWLAGAGAVVSIGSMLHNAFKGEIRVGGGFWQDSATGQTHFGGGPSGGYGGIATMSAIEQTLAGFAGGITSLLDALDITNVEVGKTIGTFESSSKGRGGTSSGGSLIIDGHEIFFGSTGPQGQGRKGAGYGGRSGSAEEMFERMTKDMAYSTLEAWQLVADRMPPMLSDMLRDIDIRSLAVEQAEALSNEIHQIAGSVNLLTEALNKMPLENLRDLGFEVSHSLIEMAGGVEALLGGVSTYYQGFYSEAEQHEHLLTQLQSRFSDLNTTMPMSREAFRALADGIDVSTEAGQRLYVSLMDMSGAAAQFYSYVEAQAAEAWGTIEAEMRASHQQYLELLRDRHQNAVKAVRDEYQARQKAYRDTMTELSEKARELNNVLRSLDSGISSLRKQSSLAEEVYRDQSRRMIDDALEMARAGQSLAGFDGLTDAINAVSKLDTSGFASQFEFELERAESVAALKELEGLTGDQVDVQELQVEALQKQIEQLDDWRDRQIDLLERQFKSSQEVANLRFEEQLAREQERFNQEIEHMLAQQALQMDANAALLHANGISQHGFGMVESAIHASANRIASAVSNMSVSVNLSGMGGARLPAFADGGYHAGGWAVVGEQGPEIVNFAQPAMIYSNAQSRNLIANAGAGNDETAGLLRQLIGEIKEMRYETRQMVINTQKTNNMLDDVTQGGTTLRTEVFNGAD